MADITDLQVVYACVEAGADLQRFYYGIEDLQDCKSVIDILKEQGASEKECWAALEAAASKGLVMVSPTQPYAYLTIHGKSKYEGSKERIVCAACKYEDGLIVCGVRHMDDLMRAQIQALAVPNWHPIEQGFVTSFGRFVGRKEAHVLAKQYNQIIRRCGNDENTLWSENLY